jgi:hypothetical protein
MQDNLNFNELDALLMKRKAPEVPYGLSERIIAAAMRADEQKRLKPEGRPRFVLFVTEVLKELEEMLAIPRPAYVLAMLLVVGLTIGTYGEYIDTTFLPGLTTNDISSFMSIDDRFVATDFLKGTSL